MGQEYNSTNIRDLLTKGFNEQKLRDFCFDDADFKPVYHQLTQNSSKTDIVAKLMEHAEQKMLFEYLLTWAKKENPDRYKEHKPYYNHSDTTKTVKNERQDILDAQRLIENLNKLLERYENIQPSFDAATCDWYDNNADPEDVIPLIMADYITRVETWAVAVTSILSAGHRENDLQNWNALVKSQAKLTSMNIEIYADNLRDLLDQIKFNIEQEYNL